MEHDFLLDALLPDSSGGNSTIAGVTTGRVTKNWDKEISLKKMSKRVSFIKKYVPMEAIALFQMHLAWDGFL